MPRFDKTGPRGLGPMTGRGLGECVDKILGKGNKNGLVANELDDVESASGTVNLKLKGEKIKTLNFKYK